MGLYILYFMGGGVDWVKDESWLLNERESFSFPLLMVVYSSVHLMAVEKNSKIH